MSATHTAQRIQKLHAKGLDAATIARKLGRPGDVERVARESNRPSVRVDIHSPGSLLPDDYTCVACFSFPTGEMGADPECDMYEWSAWEKENPGAPTPTTHRNGGCTICGTHFRHGALLRHNPTGEVLQIGHNCARRHDLALADTAWLRKKKKKSKLRMAELSKSRNARKRAEILAKHEGLEDALSADHYIIQDIACQFKRYHRLSEKQVALVMKLAAELAAKALLPPVPEDIEIPVPVGKHLVRGVVVSSKDRPGYAYGSMETKLTVKVTTDEGTWLVWGTQPVALERALDDHNHGLVYPNKLPSLKGATIEFMATITASDDKPNFGFYKRPTKATIINLKGDTDEA